MATLSTWPQEDVLETVPEGEETTAFKQAAGGWGRIYGDGGRGTNITRYRFGFDRVTQSQLRFRK